MSMTESIRKKLRPYAGHVQLVQVHAVGNGMNNRAVLMLLYSGRIVPVASGLNEGAAGHLRSEVAAFLDKEAAAKARAKRAGGAS